MEEPLINLKPQTDFEKLLFSEYHNSQLIAENKALQERIGELLSDIDELKDMLKDKGAHKYLSVKKIANERLEQIRKLQADNRKLMLELIKYKPQ